MDRNRFAKILRETRVENNLKQDELAQKIGTTQSTIAKLETAHSSPSVDTLIALAKELNVSVDYLLGLEEYL